MKRLFLVIFILSLAFSSSNAQLFHKNASRKAEKGLFGKTTVGSRKDENIKEPKKVLKAKKRQEANKKKMDKNYHKSIKQSQKRTIEIQTPEVKARMKQNQKDTATRDKIKKKKVRSSTKKAGKKYN